MYRIMLERILGSKAKVRMLTRMARNPGLGRTARDVANLTGMSYGTIHPAIHELAKARILDARRAGRSQLYMLNQRHAVYPQLIDLLSAHLNALRGAAERFAEDLDKRGVLNVILFGSVAREEAGEGSDVDVLLVTKNGKPPKNMESIEWNILEEKEIYISAVCLTREQVLERMESFDPFVLGALGEGKVLYGDDGWLRE